MTKYKWRLSIHKFVWFIFMLTVSPVLIPIALYTKKTTPRLPEASGNNFGQVTSSKSKEKKTLVFLGESPVAGVGVKYYEQSITANTAIQLSQTLDISIDWLAVGENGIDIQQTVDRLINKIDTNSIDYLVVILGVNDVTKINSFKNWALQISRLVDVIRDRSNCPIIIYGCPPLSQFPALPRLLAWVAGYRGWILDNVSKSHHLNNKEFHFIKFEPSVLPEHFALDGYHPSEEGCQEMGRQIAGDIIRLFSDKTPVTANKT